MNSVSVNSGVNGLGVNANVRLRVRHTKLGKIRFTSHRDTARHWERAIRKTGIRVAYSNGFTPRPRLAFGLALPTGAESLAEYLDIELLDQELPSVAELPGLFTAELPSGYEVTAVMLRTGDEAASLQEVVVATSWTIAVVGPSGDEVAQAVDRANAASELLVERQRKGHRHVDDVRGAIESLSVADSVSPNDEPVDEHVDRRPHLCAVLDTTGRGLRPIELIGAVFPHLDPLDVMGRVVRMEQWIERDGLRREIIPVLSPAASAAAAADA